MIRLAVLLLAALLAVSAAIRDSIADTVFLADLTNAGEPGGVTPTLSDNVTPRPASFGTAVFVLNTAETEMRMFAEVHNIDFTGTQTADVNDNLTAAHIHAFNPPVPPNPPPATGGVVWGFFGLPFNDNNPNDHIVTPFPTGVGGTISGKWDAPEGNGTTLGAQLNNIKEGRSYANFHTRQFGGGEIRGTLVIIPEPSAILIAVIAAGGLFGSRRREPTRDALNGYPPARR